MAVLPFYQRFCRSVKLSLDHFRDRQKEHFSSDLIPRTDASRSLIETRLRITLLSFCEGMLTFRFLPFDEFAIYHTLVLISGWQMLQYFTILGVFIGVKMYIGYPSVFQRKENLAENLTIGINGLYNRISYKQHIPMVTCFGANFVFHQMLWIIFYNE